MIPEDIVVHISQYFHFSPEEIFDAWVTPQVAKRWLFAGKNNIVHAEIDLKIGGRFSFQERENGITIEHSGKYFEIDRPGHLAFSLKVPRRFSGTTYVSVFISPKGAGCELTLTQTGVSPEKTEARWYQSFSRLEKALDSRSAVVNMENGPADPSTDPFAPPARQ